MADIIRAQNLRKIFKVNEAEVHAVNGIDINVAEAETIAIMGPSGSGKSTLLHMLGLMEKPTEGTIFFNGKDASGLNDAEKALIRNRGIGFVFQFHYLLPEFTVLENALIPARLAGGNIDIKYAREKAAELLAKTGLEKRANHTPSQLSGGEQQRAAIVRALMNSPRILLSDEPTGDLDLETGLKVLDLMFGLAGETKTSIVIVTHNPDIANRAGRTVRLLNGRVIATP